LARVRNETIEIHARFWWGNPEGRNHFAGICIYNWIILKWILNKYVGRLWVGFFCLNIRILGKNIV
jgi:hypothetical protein